MRRFIALIAMLLPLMAIAQNPDFSKLTKKYAGNDKVMVMNLSQQQLMAFIDDDDSAEDLKNIDSITLMMTEEKALGEEIFKTASKTIKRIKAEEMLSTSDEEYNIRVYTTSNDDVITSVILSIISDEQSGLVIINGTIPSDELNNLIKLQTDKMEL
ncbi:MAG: DUF4252 domain-containing protein [Alistipes sp.]|nr:DUF4252 domain-containing protein [Alistipes sp.]